MCCDDVTKTYQCMKLSIDVLNSVLKKIGPRGPEQKSDSFRGFFYFQEKASILKELVKINAANDTNKTNIRVIISWLACSYVKARSNWTIFERKRFFLAPIDTGIFKIDIQNGRFSSGTWKIATNQMGVVPIQVYDFCESHLGNKVSNCFKIH